MNNRLIWAEALMSEGGLLPVDVAMGFMADGYDINSIDDSRYDREFVITPELIDQLTYE